AAGARLRRDDRAAVAPAVDDVGVLGVGDDVAALAAGGRLPVAGADAGAAAARQDAQRRVVLLRAEDAEGGVGVGRDAVELRRRLVVLGRPGPAAVVGDGGAAVVRFDHPQRVVGIDPEVVVVAVRDADAGEALAAVLGVEEEDVGGVDPVVVLGVGIDVAVVPGALAELAVVAGLGPGLPRVARAEEPPLRRLDDGVEVVRIGGGDGDAVDADRPLGESGVAGQLAPVVAAVGGLPDPGAGAAALQAVGGAAEIPHRGVEDARVGGVHREVDGAHPVIDEQHPLPVAAAVLGAVDAARLVGAE